LFKDFRNGLNSKGRKILGGDRQYLCESSMKKLVDPAKRADLKAAAQDSGKFYEPVTPL
jgi:hypothetical protein